MSNSMYEQETALTGMIVWEHFITEPNSEFHKALDDIDIGAVEHRQACLDIANAIEQAWASLSPEARVSFIDTHCDNDIWDWEVVPKICNLIAKSNLLDRNTAQVPDLISIFNVPLEVA